MASFLLFLRHAFASLARFTDVVPQPADRLLAAFVLEAEHALDDEPVKKYKAGDTFYEPSGSVHQVARNPSGKTRTRLLAVILHSRDTKETKVPEKGKE